MDLLLRGRGADISARAPLSLLRLLGAALGFCIYILADLLGVREVSGLSLWLMLSVSAIAGALLAPSRFGSVLWIALGLLIGTVSIVGFTPVVGVPAQHFIRADASNAPVDAVIVLSGSVTGEGMLSLPVMNRFVSGIGEARRRGVRNLALSIVDNGSSVSLRTSDADQRRLVTELAPDLEVLFVRDVHSTHDEALQFVALGRTHGWQRVAVVTSPLHTRRSCRTFEKVGLPVVCVPAGQREYSVVRLGGLFSRLNVFRDVMYETIATSVYSARGWN